MPVVRFSASMRLGSELSAGLGRGIPAMYHVIKISRDVNHDLKTETRQST